MRYAVFLVKVYPYLGYLKRIKWIWLVTRSLRAFLTTACQSNFVKVKRDCASRSIYGIKLIQFGIHFDLIDRVFCHFSFVNLSLCRNWETVAQLNFLSNSKWTRLNYSNTLQFRQHELGHGQINPMADCKNNKITNHNFLIQPTHGFLHRFRILGILGKLGIKRAHTVLGDKWDSCKLRFHSCFVTPQIRVRNRTWILCHLDGRNI